MDSRRVQDELIIIGFYHIFHSMILILLIIAHLLYIIRYGYVNLLLFSLALIGLAIYIAQALFLIRPLYLIKKKKFHPTSIVRVKNIFKFLLFITLLNGILLSLIYWINYYNLPSFLKECPYNFKSKDMKKLFNYYKDKNNSKYEKKCRYRRCLIDKSSKKNNKNNYVYLCNFDPQLISQFFSDNMQCEYIYDKNEYTNIDRDFDDYLNYCNDYVVFYKCSHNFFVKKKYSPKYNYKCPKSVKNKHYEILGIMFNIIDIFGVIFIIYFTRFEYKKLIFYINIVSPFGRDQIGNRLTASSLNSTCESSVIKNKNNMGVRDFFRQINYRQIRWIIYPPSIIEVKKKKKIGKKEIKRKIGKIGNKENKLKDNINKNNNYYIFENDNYCDSERRLKNKSKDNLLYLNITNK